MCRFKLRRFVVKALNQFYNVLSKNVSPLHYMKHLVEACKQFLQWKQLRSVCVVVAAATNIAVLFISEKH